MVNISECRNLRKIYESSSSTVYRAIRGAEKLPVILKILKQDFPTPEQIVKYKQEYRIIRKLGKLSNVIEVYAIEKNHNGLIITFEDFGAESLNLLMNSQRFSLEECLLIAIQTCVGLGKIHAVNVVHKNINPSNIVINRATNQLKIIDFGIATDLTQENAMMVNPCILDGTLAYMSPEQTGRMNRPIDYRSDYYSLGVTFYELFTGRLPFETTDPLELVHCHVARKPTPPHEINYAVDEGISDIILKLMAKNAEDRYQSAFGIKVDLDLCLSEVQSNNTVKGFQLGCSDIPEKFVITPHLYGRDDEKKALIGAFNRVAAGNKEIASVSGQGGIGKTSLVRQLYKPITEQRGYFLTGKFDQLHGNVLHGALVAPFRELVNQILSESENNLIAWKSKLLDALGSNCKVIMDVIPEIELIVGPQPSVPELEPIEAQNRFHIVFQTFIRAFCRPEQPLVVFLDDVQWADSSSLKLLELIMTDAETKYLLVIISYRDEEVDVSHPVTMTLETLRKENVRINILQLEPLQLKHVVELISATLHRDKLKVVQLAELVHQKTAGNPFFLKEFFKALHDEGLLEFDSEFGGWLWSMEEIQRRQITDNVVDLMVNKIQRLPAITRDLLKEAACLGNQFGVNTLAWSFSDSPRNIVVALNVAVSEGLIFPVGAGYKWIELEVADTANTKKIDYKFAHDRIQNAAYSLIPEKERPRIHLKLGRIILANTPADHLDDEIFEIVNQLNLAPGLVSNGKEQVELAEMNLRAGKRAKASAAYESSFTHFKTGLNLLGEDSWQNHYELVLALFLEAVESAYLTTKFDEMERLGSVVIERATRLLDKVKVYEMKIMACIALNNRVEAVLTALPVLALLGEKFPKDPGKLTVFADFMKTKLVLANRGMETLVNLPEMVDPKKLAVMRILASVLSATYTVVPNLLPMVVFKMVRLSIKYGIASQSALGFSAYAMILCTIIGDVDSGCKLGDLALELVNKVNLKEDKARINFVVNSFIRIWREPLRAGLAFLRDGYQVGLQVGDLEYAALSGAFYCTQGYAAGKELPGLEKELALYTNAIGKLKQETTKCLTQIYHQGVLNLMGHCENNCLLIGKAYNEKDILPTMFELNERAIILSTFVHKLILCYLFHNYSEAVGNSSVVENYLDGAQGTVLVPLAAFYGSLARLGLFSDSNAKLKDSILKKVTKNQKILKKWSRSAPMNYLNKFHLVEAERARIMRRYHEATDHYDMAIKLAGENEYLNEEALALERAAIFYASIDKIISARAYMQEARYCYLKWGALAKVRHLDEVYPNLLVKNSLSHMGRSQISAVYPESPASAPEGILDMAAVLRASQALSGEIVLNDLLKRLMSLMIETAGAEKGSLILTKNNDLVIEARTSITTGEEFELSTIRIEDSEELSLAVVNYVARTKEPVILDDAGTANAFVNDDYMLRKRPRSVFCLPIMRRGQLSGILYMENNQTIGAFTPERVEVMGVLSAQAAISIENALLYKNLEESAEKYRSLFENAQETIFIVQDGSIKFSNPRTSDLTGYSSAELSSLPFTNFIHPDDQDLVSEQNMKGLTEESVSNVYPFRIVRKDGATLWVQINSVLVNWEGCPATLNFLTDITELKKAADLNIRTERLKATGELAAGVAHNFNNVLQIIMAGVEMALIDLESGNTSRIKNYLEQVRDSSRFGSETVKRLQSFAKIRIEGEFSDSKRFDLSQLVKQVSEIGKPWWKTNLERDGIQVDLKLDLENGCFVFGKESELFEVLINLIKNAWEAMPKGGDIRIKTAIIEDHIILEISDAGIGVSSEDMERLFEPFWSTKGTAGTGLGLAASHGIVSSHGGTITAASKHGEGTTFTIKLPLACASHEETSTHLPMDFDLNLKILVVDDTAPLVTLLHDLLTSYNQSVLVAHSGKAALDLFRHNEFDLVICDLGMPEISGWEVAKTVKMICEAKQISKTPFLLLTGWGGQSLDPDEIVKSGIDGVLEKPIDVPKLFKMIRKVINKRLGAIPND